MARRTPIRRPRWQRRPDARPEEILDAAVEVFGELGFERTKLDDVARRAGVSKGTLYLYFDSKDALFRAMMKQRLEAKIAWGEELVRGWTGSATELLRALVTAHWQSMNQPQNVRLIRLVMSELGSFPELAKWYYQEGILRMRGIVEKILARGVASGEFRPMNLAFTARSLQFLCSQSAQFRHYLQPFDATPMSGEAMLEGILELFLTGVLAQPARPVAER